MLKDDEIGEPNSRRADPINIISDHKYFSKSMIT